jgi:hypothetical protein
MKNEKLVIGSLKANPLFIFHFSFFTFKLHFAARKNWHLVPCQFLRLVLD